ncbi:MAG: S46 family peptidase, partial [Verrucomicrobiota bacterium]
RESSVRFNTGGSGSFVSSEGLILTNHHVGAGIIAALSTAEEDLIQDGFVAATREAERPCRDLELNVLVSIRDVTDEVEAVVSGDGDEAVMQRRAAMAKLEAVPEGKRDRLRRDVVTLYKGGAYHLYEYRRYTDVRLVMAPESAVAAFGGDADNFEYPRYCLDFCLFRAYEDGKPVRVEHFLKWGASGAQDGELVFVSGHPGSTNRALTHAQVKRMRDVRTPYSLERLKRREVLLSAWSARDLENRRRAKGRLIGTQNGRKALDGRLAGLLDPGFMAGHLQAEQAFRERLSEVDGGEEAEAAFIEIEALMERQQKDGFRGALIGGGDGFGCDLFWLARDLVVAARERQKPDAERRSGFREADRVSLELGLFSEDPIYRNLNELLLGDSLTFFCEQLGSDDPTVVQVLAGRSPQARAAELVAGCKLDQVELRKRLYEGGMEAIQASTDPMIAMARALDEETELLQERWERDNEALKQAHARIAAARFAMEGESVYPDATFSLRLSFGKVSGIEDGDIPFNTNFGGLFAREEAQQSTPPFNLPERWKTAAVEGSVALNFISTNDITGGNSGSPVVNGAGELVGLIFDANLDGLTNDVAYDERRARAVSVDAAGILHSLDAVYQADHLVAELRGSGD